METLHEDLCTFMIVYRWILFRIRKLSDKRCRENQNKHVMFSSFFWKLCHLWHIVGKCGRDGQATYDNIIWCMFFTCWITKATDTHTHTLRIYNDYCFSMATIVMRTCLNVTLYMHCIYWIKSSKHENWVAAPISWVVRRTDPSNVGYTGSWLAYQILFQHLIWSADNRRLNESGFSSSEAC